MVLPLKDCLHHKIATAIFLCHAIWFCFSQLHRVNTFIYILSSLNFTQPICFNKEECIPVRCVPPACYQTETPWTETPTETLLDRDPLRQKPPHLDRDPHVPPARYQTETPTLDREPPGQRPNRRQRPPGQRPQPWTETRWIETPWLCDPWCMLGQRSPWTDLWSCDLWCILRETARPSWTESQIRVKTLLCRNLKNLSEKIGKEKTSIENESNCLIKTVTPLKAVIILTRMHSSRMRTAHLLPVSHRMHCSRRVEPGPGGVPGPGVVYLVLGGVPTPVVYLVPGGCNWSHGGYLVLGGSGTWSEGDTWSRGSTCPGTSGGGYPPPPP